MFQSTYLYKVRQQATATAPEKVGFNPRTYIRYDLTRTATRIKLILFQSTYLYKVRLLLHYHLGCTYLFQSTYLYKVRPGINTIGQAHIVFQSTYLYKVRRRQAFPSRIYRGFNPRTYIRYDYCDVLSHGQRTCFNPRTYIRYDYFYEHSVMS